MKQLTFDDAMDSWRRLAPRMTDEQLRELVRFDRDFDAMFVRQFDTIPRSPAEVYAASEALDSRPTIKGRGED